MKLLILTTQTTHHTKFVQDIMDDDIELKVVLETKSLKPKFDCSHSYINEQEEYERKLWFSGEDVQIKDLVDTYEVESVNSDIVQSLINNFKPDLIIVFGTGKILPCIINLMPDQILNLHGGDPEEYRGLDTHLWAIYHGEFDQLITSLHRVSPDLDTGDIVGRKPLHLKREMDLRELRAENTRICVSLVKEAIDCYLKNNRIEFIPQQKKGRYYSFMPSVLKDICVRKFRKFTNDLS